MKDFKKYSIQKLVKKINRKGSVLQKRAVKLCSQLELLIKPELAEELILVGAVVFDLCSWGYKEVELVYKTSSREELITYLDSKYSHLANYKHTIYTNGDTIVSFFYDDWKFILHVTKSESNIKKIQFTRDYLIDNLSPNDRENIVSMCRAGTPMGTSIKSSIKLRFGDDHALYRLSNLQIDDIRYDTLSPIFQFLIISGIIIEQMWNPEEKNWMLKK